MSIVEKMANDAAGPAWERFRNDPDVIRDWVTEEREHLARVLRATGLTEAQLEGLANGDLVILPNPLKARERADAVADRAMLAAKEGVNDP